MSVPSALSPFAELFQDRVLLRSFEDSLLPNFLWGAIAPEAQEWIGGSGLSFTVTNDGYYNSGAAPTPTTVDPVPAGRRAEQFDVTLAAYQGTDDVDATQAQNMLADYARQTYNRLGIDAAQAVDRAARGVYASAATAGWTVADGTQASSTTIQVKRLNGFGSYLPSTGSELRHSPVSASNPLPVLINGVARNVIGVTADQVIAVNQGVGVPDLMGPGKILLDAAIAVTDRDPIIAQNASWVYRSGAGVNRLTGSIDDTSAPMSYSNIRQARKRFSQTGVKPMRNYGNHFMAQIPSSAMEQLQGDPEYQRLAQGRGIEDFAYVRGVAGIISQCLLVENNRAMGDGWFSGSPAAQVATPTTYGKWTSYGMANVSTDLLGLEVLAKNDASLPVDHTIFVGDDAVKHFYQPHPLMRDVAALQEIGVSGIVAEPFRVTNDSVVLETDYINMIMVSPRNRTADKFPVTWQTKRSWTVKSDQISPQSRGTRYLRMLAIETLADE